MNLLTYNKCSIWSLPILSYLNVLNLKQKPQKPLTLFQRWLDQHDRAWDKETFWVGTTGIEPMITQTSGRAPYPPRYVVLLVTPPPSPCAYRFLIVDSFFYVNIYHIWSQTNICPETPHNYLYPLWLREIMDSKVILLSSNATGVLHTAKISTVEVIISRDKSTKIVNFKYFFHEFFFVWELGKNK